MQADRGHPAVGEQLPRDIRLPNAGLVPDSDQVGDGKTPRLHRYVDRDVAALGENRDAGIAPLSAVLVGPDRRAVHEVDHSVAVRTEERHPVRRLDQAGLHVRAARVLEARFREPGREADRAPGAAGRQAFEQGRRQRAAYADEARVRGAGKIIDASVAFPALHLGLVGMHGPYLAIVPHEVALLDDVFRPVAAEGGDVPRPEHAAEAGGARNHPPIGRSSSRAMMWRWISEVPSQIRSTRASRQNRSNGRSDMRPIPPWIWMHSSAT